MEKQKIFIFACGGQGTRMGADIPKQFLRIGDKTILQLCIERVVEAMGKVRIIVVLPSAYIDFWNKECSRAGFGVPMAVIKGGITRFHSVKNALEKVPRGAIVAVHDGVRPFVSAELINALFEKVKEAPAVVPVIPVTDTLKAIRRLPDGTLEAIAGQAPDRSLIFGAQTPQVFHSEVLLDAYSQPFSTAFTDDASVVEKYGCAISYIDGEKYNIKITTPEDLVIAKALMG